MSLGRALLVLGRVSNLPTIWSNCLCGWLIGVGYIGIEPIDWRMIAWVGFGATALYLGGMYLNDACDVAFDREHRKEDDAGNQAEAQGWWWHTCRLPFGYLMGWVHLRAASARHATGLEQS